MTNSPELTGVVKSIITRFKLIDTGLLIKSVNVSYTLIGSNCTITITAQEYFKYHLESINFEKVFTNSRGFDEFVARVFSPVIEKNFQKSIERGVDYTVIPKMSVEFNWI